MPDADRHDIPRLGEPADLRHEVQVERDERRATHATRTPATTSREPRSHRVPQRRDDERGHQQRTSAAIDDRRDGRLPVPELPDHLPDPELGAASVAISPRISPATAAGALRQRREVVGAGHQQPARRDDRARRHEAAEDRPGVPPAEQRRHAGPAALARHAATTSANSTGPRCRTVMSSARRDAGQREQHLTPPRERANPRSAAPSRPLSCCRIAATARRTAARRALISRPFGLTDPARFITIGVLTSASPASSSAAAQPDRDRGGARQQQRGQQRRDQPRPAARRWRPG